MIRFRRKTFSEYDAMRSLYVELMRYSDRTKFGIIDTSSLIPILRGNNVVIEKFVISTSMFGKDKYRMYLKIGARAKMPDEVRLPQRVYDRRLGNMQLNISKGIFDNDNYNNSNNNNNNNQNGGGDKGEIELNTPAPTNDKIKDNNNYNKDGKNKGRYGRKTMSEITFREKQFGKNDKKQFPFVSAQFSPHIDLSYEVKELLGDAILYDKKSRSLVLEFATIRDAIQALNILPFGLGYKIFLLNA